LQSYAIPGILAKRTGVGQTLLSVQCDIAAGRADTQECLSYSNLSADKLTGYEQFVVGQY